MRKSLSAVVAVTVLILPTQSSQAANPKIGTTCNKLNLKQASAGKIYTCIKSGKKLIWDSGIPSPKSSPLSRNSEYEKIKLKAYNNIRAEADKGNLDNVSISYHVSDYFPKDLLALYKSQVEYASKLYGSFFSKKENVNIYLYTEKDEDYLKSEKLFSQDMPDHSQWFQAWREGRDQQHNLGLAAWYMEYPNQEDWAGHAGLLVYSGATTSSLRKYAIQVMPHEYWHVVQDYYIQKGRGTFFTDQDSYDRMFPPTFREGSANTISFALASNSPQDYLALYKDFITTKKMDSSMTTFKTLTNTQAVVKTLGQIETRNGFAEAHEASYSIGSLLYEWVIAEYGFPAYRKLIENQLIGKSFADNVKASLGISVAEMYSGAAPHILAAFTQ